VSALQGGGVRFGSGGEMDGEVKGGIAGGGCRYVGKICEVETSRLVPSAYAVG
jgi:hypothetical protein